MKNFACETCHSRVYFGNVKCLTCGDDLAFDPQSLKILSMKPLYGQPGRYELVKKSSDDASLHYCANVVHGACNWLVRSDDNRDKCIACSSNRTIPNLSEPGNLEAWQLLERAKKRLFYQFLRLDLPLDGTRVGKGKLTFDFVRDALTGHLDGVITIDIMEADAVERERQRQNFDEPYRSLLGHFRHESGHFYWSVLVDAVGGHDAFRAVFGDERVDYVSSLARHHETGPTANWQDHFVSAYASAHPWEDFAETWAHYLHMLAAIDTAEAEGMEPRASGLTLGAIWPFKSEDVYKQSLFDSLMSRWIPLALALNSVSRSMGHADFYPFVISDNAQRKLAFIHDLITNSRLK